MSHTAADALRTTYCVVQMGSKLARFACGTNRSVFAAAFCEIAGVNNPPVVTKAPAPALVFKNVLRSITLVSLFPSELPKTASVCHLFWRIAYSLRRPSADSNQAHGQSGRGANGMPYLAARE